MSLPELFRAENIQPSLHMSKWPYLPSFVPNWIYTLQLSRNFGYELNSLSPLFPRQAIFVVNLGSDMGQVIRGHITSNNGTWSRAKPVVLFWKRKIYLLAIRKIRERYWRPFRFLHNSLTAARDQGYRVQNLPRSWTLQQTNSQL